MADIHEDLETDERIDAQRQILRDSLIEIADELGSRLRKAGLNLPVFFTVPSSGLAILNMATPVDSADDGNDEWSKVTEIVCEIVSARLDGIGLRSHELPCAKANCSAVSAADLTAN